MASLQERLEAKIRTATRKIGILDARIADWQADPENNGPKRQTALNKINNRYNNKVMPLVQSLYRQWELLEDKVAAAAAPVPAVIAKRDAKRAKIEALIPVWLAANPFPALRQITNAVNAERDKKILEAVADADRRVNAANVQKIELQAQHTRLGQEKAALGGSSRKQKKVRNHKGIVQTGGNKGKLRKGYKYTGKRLKNNMPEIKKVKAKK